MFSQFSHFVKLKVRFFAGSQGYVGNYKYRMEDGKKVCNCTVTPLKIEKNPQLQSGTIVLQEEKVNHEFTTLYGDSFINYSCGIATLASGVYSFYERSITIHIENSMYISITYQIVSVYISFAYKIVSMYICITYKILSVYISITYKIVSMYISITYIIVSIVKESGLSPLPVIPIGIHGMPAHNRQSTVTLPLLRQA